ncbi:MAG: Wzz/FepE/Etk N-terminal domain-containing protein [Sediminibacterium sp.]|nr:Wzz/FepE/Etk N-terminal domain-containing protein [Sediminibacterium sp.]
MYEEMNNINNSDEITLKELIQKISEWFRYLKTQWWKIAIVGIVGGAIGFFYALLQPTTYTAKKSFLVEDGKNNSTNLGGLASIVGQLGVDVAASGGGLFAGDNILLYFKSASLSREVLLSKFDSGSSKSVADVFVEVYQLNDEWENKIGKVFFEPYTTSSEYTRLQDSLLQIIGEDILTSKFSVERVDKKAGFINVNTTMESEVLAKLYCERLVQIAVNKYIEIKTQRQKASVDKLQERADSIARLLSKKILSGATLQTSNSTMDINPLYRTGTTAAVETTGRDKAILSTIFASVTQNLEFAKFTLSQETPVIQVVDSPMFPLKINKVSKRITAISLSLILGFLYVIFLVGRRYFLIKLRD